MGRTSGGGGRSSGGFGGGRSSGGFNLGGRGSSSGGASRRPNPMPRMRPTPGPRPMHGGYIPSPFGYRPRPHMGGGGCGCGTAFILIAILFVLMALVSIFSSGNSVTQVQNTTKREKLEGLVNKTQYYQDDIGWVKDKNQLVKGLETFYSKTGVQPFILMVPYDAKFWNGNNLNTEVADEYLDKFYDENFTDEAHYLFAYFEAKNDSKAEMEGDFRYINGYKVDSIMDTEANTIFRAYLKKNYDNLNLSMEQMLSNTFAETAEQIMSKPTSKYDFWIVIVVVGGACLVIFIIYKISKSKQQREKEKEEYTKEILSKPLDTFGSDTKDLEDKYK